MRPATADKLVTVAGVYREAARLGKPPTMAVAEHFGVAKTAAAKLVARARNSGHLEPTSRGVSTRPKHSQTIATIHRDTSLERHWEVCQTCLTQWPCAESRTS